MSGSRLEGGLGGPEVQCGGALKDLRLARNER